MILEALRGLAALPKLIEAVERIGDKLDDKAAMERLPDGGADVDGPAPGGPESGG